jgi:uncharacterized membrane protein
VTTKSATLKKIGNALNTGDDKGVIIAVAIALIVIFALVAGYYLVFHPAPEGYTDIYVLDAQGQAVNYTETLVVNRNTTYDVWVENHMGQTLTCEVQVKVTNESISQFPVNVNPVSTYTKPLANGEKWEIQATVALHETGSHSIVFELWTHSDKGETEFTGNADVLNVEAVNQP